LADNEEEGVIRRAKKPRAESAPAAAPAATSTPAAEPAADADAAGAASGDGHAHKDGAPCPSCTRLRAALRSARQRLRRLTTENKTLREELLSAGEMIENLAQDLEKPY
jgi:hypothetical protein